MSESPYSHLSEEEQRALDERCSNGDEFIFAGEEITTPGGLATAHSGLIGNLFEVSPTDLLEVAKHLDREGERPKKTIERAYSLICEAHVFSRNLKHWNDKSKRDHVSQVIHDLVEEHVVSDGKNQGKVPRIPLLQAFLKKVKGTSNSTEAGKIFNRWVKETLRRKSFENNIPWNPKREDFDRKLNSTLSENGWIRWNNFGRGNHLILPQQTKKPDHKSRTKPRKEDHETRPWWNTKTTWWPNPTTEEQKNFKSRFLCDKQSNFRNAYAAKQCLKYFDQWLKVQSDIDEESSGKRKSRKTDPATGRFC